MRQSHLAGVDAALACWFAGAVWAGARLAERARLADYLLAGGLVGLAASTKYPGALAGAAAVAVHLAAGRSPADGRLWSAGAAAIGCFVLASPYVLLDWNTFQQHFLSQVSHLETGHGQDLGRGWGYHLRVSLPWGLGWLALALAGFRAIAGLKRRNPAELGVLAGFAVFYLVMGVGQSVFTRYALPLLPLQAVLAGGALARVPCTAWLVLASILVCAQPLYASFRTLQLLGRPDTRAQARAWIEANVPEGTGIGNFGGWAGDVRVRTFEELWWEISHFEHVFGWERLDRAIAFLEQQPRTALFYSFGIQRSNIQAASGSMEEIERLEPGYAILHQHPLAYSRVDSGFAASLGTIAERVVSFAPAGLWQEAPLYDPLDAFYVPLGNFGGLVQPGPDIEIWRVKAVPLPAKERLSVRAVFARGYATGAATEMNRGNTEGALQRFHRALELDPECAEAYFLLAFLYQRDGKTEEALSLYREYLRLQPENATASYNLAVLYQSLGDLEQGEQLLREAVRRAPWRRHSYAALAAFYQGQKRYDQAIQVCAKQLEYFPAQGFAFEALGQAWEQAGLSEQAEKVYQAGLQRDPSYEPLYLRLAQCYLARQRYPQAVETCEALLRMNPRQAGAHRLLAHTCRLLGQTGKAKDHARQAIRLAPGADPELEAWLGKQ